MKQKVLLLDDDNESLLRSLPYSLLSETYEVVLVKNIQQAISKSAAGEIDLLLMNLDSPTEQRWEAIGAITRENPFLPIVVITTQPELRNPAEAAGVCALVEKPVDVPMLLQTIHELLAEPAQKRVARVLNHISNFRHVASSSGDVRDLPHGRYTAPLRHPLPSQWGINE